MLKPNWELTEGKIEAPSEDQAVNALQQKGFLILSLEEARKDLFARFNICFQQAFTKGCRDVYKADGYPS